MTSTASAGVMGCSENAIAVGDGCLNTLFEMVEKGKERGVMGFATFFVCIGL